MNAFLRFPVITIGQDGSLFFLEQWLLRQKKTPERLGRSFNYMKAERSGLLKQLTLSTPSALWILSFGNPSFPVPIFHGYQGFRVLPHAVSSHAFGKICSARSGHHLAGRPPFMPIPNSLTRLKAGRSFSGSSINIKSSCCSYNSFREQQNHLSLTHEPQS